MPPFGSRNVNRLPQPYQSIGARGVNNLAAKLLLALLPTNAPFFRMLLDDFMLERITQREGMRAEVEKALNKIERSVMTEIEATAIRVSTFELLKQLINAGNVLAYMLPKGGMRVFRLDRFVVLRSPSGDVLEIIVQEEVSPAALPQDLRDLVGKDASGNPEKTLELYTWVRRDGDFFRVHQEIKGIKVPRSHGTYPIEKTPWLALRWTKIDGEDYGRGYVEEYMGDLRSLEGLSKAILEGAAAAAKVLFLVDPNGTTSVKTLTDSENGAVRPGKETDVSVLQVQKAHDFQTAEKQVARLQQNLSFAFLMNSSVQRNGERVTAEEIRYMAGELEDALGGVYSILSQEFQLPLVKGQMHRLERAGRLPSLPKGVVRPAITTGLEALGRGHDLNKLNLFVQQIAQFPGAPERLNVGDLVMRIGTALGIDMAGLVKNDEDIQRDQMANMMQQLMLKLGPNAVNIIGDLLKGQQQGAPQAPDGHVQQAPPAVAAQAQPGEAAQ
jgi:hypothetical protein